MLTSYKAVLAIPNNGNAEAYTFTDLYFDAGSHMTVPELAETAIRTFCSDVNQSGNYPVDGTVIVRISRTDLARYVFRDDFNSYYGLADANNVGYTDTILYRDSELDSVYAEYKKKKDEEIKKNGFGPSIPDEEIPF